MKKYLVIGNPIDHSLSPQIHNYWIKKNNISGIFDKQKLNSNNLNELIIKIKNNEINGLNVTVPFKKWNNFLFRYIKWWSPNNSISNTIYLENNKVVGHNTDIDGFELAIKDKDYEVKGKRIFILGAGGVVPSIIFALNKMKASEIVISNRTKQKAENLKDLFNNLSIVDWGKIPYFDMIINATSLGLNNKDNINLDFSKIEKGKFFYDVIYNPKETNFLRKAKLMGNQTENGKKCLFIKLPLPSKFGIIFIQKLMKG